MGAYFHDWIRVHISRVYSKQNAISLFFQVVMIELYIRRKVFYSYNTTTVLDPAVPAGMGGCGAQSSNIFVVYEYL